MAGVGRCDTCLMPSNSWGYCGECAAQFALDDPQTAKVVRAMGRIAGRDEIARREGESLEEHRTRCSDASHDDTTRIRRSLAAWEAFRAGTSWPATAQDTYLDGWHSAQSTIIMKALGRRRKAE